MKNMKKRILSGLLCLVMSLTLLPTAVMAAGHFTDVSEKDWFYADVEYAVQLGLVNGETPTTYSPSSYLTYGAAIKLAACMHKKVTQDNTDFTVGAPWYQVYVDYAIANGIITAGKTYDWDANATRAGYMEIFANAIPDTGLKRDYKALTAVNLVDDNTIPDVPAGHPQADAIYKLYRAGILQGNSTVTHECCPDNFIQRSEVAAILTRMMNADARVKFEMIDDSGMSVTQQPADVEFLSADGRAVFSTAVTGGKGPYTYKWFRSDDDGVTWNLIINDTQHSGVSTRKLTVKPGSPDACVGVLYRCQISDAAGHQVVTRSARVIGSSSPLTVTQQPQNVTGKVGDWISYSVTVSGGKAPYTYQWQSRSDDNDWGNVVNGSSLKGSTAAKLETRILTEDFDYGYRYRCKITDADGSVVYSNTVYAIKSADSLTITTQPENDTCETGEQAVFAVTVSGGRAPYTYQWQWQLKDDTSWSNLSDSSYVDGADTNEVWIVVTAVDFDRGYRYRCKITDAGGDMVYSDTVTVIEAASPLTITTQPEDATGAVGDHVSFSVKVSGGKAPYTYQWQYCYVGGSWTYVEDDALVSGATASQLDIVVTEDVIDSLYQYRCWVYDADHKFLCSDPVIVIEDTTPRITSQPVSGSASTGYHVKLTMEVTGGKSPCSYQWQYSTDGGSNWTNIANSTKYSGAQSSTLTVTIDGAIVDSASTLYRCRFTDSANHTLYSNTVTATYRRPTVAH